MTDEIAGADPIETDAETESAEAQENPGRPTSDGFVTSRFIPKLIHTFAEFILPTRV